MYIRGLDLNAVRDIDERTQVIEIRMRDEERVDDSAAFRGPRNQRPRCDIAHRARPPVEEDERATRLDADRGSVADGEHGACESRVIVRIRYPRDGLARADSCRDACDHEPSRPPQCAGGTDDDRYDRRAQHDPGKPRQRSDGDASRSSSGCDIDELDLKPRWHPDERTKRSGQLLRDRTDDRLWVGDHERQRGERRAQEREQDPERL